MGDDEGTRVVALDICSPQAVAEGCVAKHQVIMHEQAIPPGSCRGTLEQERAR